MGFRQVGQSSWSVPAACKGASSPEGLRAPEPIVNPPPSGGVRSGAMAGLGYSGGSAGVGGIGGAVPASARNPTGPAAGGFDWRSAGGSVSSGAPPAPATTRMDMPGYRAPPPPQSYAAYDPQSAPIAGNLRELSGYGSDLLDPNSDYYKELVSRMRGDIGKSTAASKRSAALMGAEQGFGAGASPEVMSVMGDIGEAGRIAEGEAMGDISLAAPQLGAGMMASTFGPGVSLEGIGEQSGQFGAGLREAGVVGRAGMAEGARKYGVGVGLEQQRMAENRAQREAEMRTQQQQWEAEFGLREDAMAAEYGTYGPEEGGYGGGAMGARV